MSEPDPQERFQILALSGGGYRGLFTARVLADMEQSIGAPIATRFDLLAGTSIGGILALALALEITADRMVRLFETKGEQIFQRRRSLGGLWRAPYAQSSLYQLLCGPELFGENTVGACRHPVLVPAINYTTGRPVVFKTPHHPNFVTDHKHRMADVALATSAAPGFFPRHVFNNCQYIDGGLFANAPGLLGVHEARHFMKQQRGDIHVVAIGTMSAKYTVDPRRNREGGTRDWGGWWPPNTAKRLFGVAISAQESLVDNLLRHQLPAGHYHHVDEDLTDERARAVALDKTDAAAREVLLGSAAERSKICLGDAGVRAVLNHIAPTPTFYHGPYAVQGVSHAQVE
ncbi:MAG: patatin-like phospholipase family protein [Xanthomonadales bacterium]|nr:patatin-like phospholipase family protein [Xanthomonadales bacterium]